MQDASFGGNVRGMTIMQSFVLLGASIVDEDAINDLALLLPAWNPFAGEAPGLVQVGDHSIGPVYGLCSPEVERPADGTSVAASGYPLSNQALITNAGCIASGWLSDADARRLLLLREGPGSYDHVDRYLADLEVNGGNSGGPVYETERGQVIGVCVATQNAYVTAAAEPVRTQDGSPLVYSSGLTIVVPSKYVVALLERHNLSWGGST
jgi:S1-C subfamily serine protease